MDFYASVRSLYLQDRQQKISNSNPTIEIMYEGDWEEVESQTKINQTVGDIMISQNNFNTS